MAINILIVKNHDTSSAWAQKACPSYRTQIDRINSICKQCWAEIMTYQPPHNELASYRGKLYKYRAISDTEGLDQAVSMIRDHSLWFWHLTGQNDPKECKPKVFFGGDRQDIYRYFVNDLSTAYPGADPNEIH